jgi:hypothetical protein
MARANQSAPHLLPVDAPITVLYIRAADADLPYLDRQIAILVERYAPHVELRVLAPEHVPVELADKAQRTPTVLVLRRGEIVGEAIGAFLPMRELDRVVRCAVEWAG